MDGDPVTSGEHPDPDLLADLAAQVLPADLSTRIETHVLGCGYCAGVLAEAEGLQSALRALPPEPMPADIGQRLERAVASERAAMRAGILGSDTGSQRRAADVKASGTGPLPTRRSLREAGSTGEITTAGQSPGINDPSRTSGMGTGSIQSSGLGTGVTPVGAGAASTPRPGPATGSTGRIRIGQGQDRAGQVSRLRRVTSSRSGARRQALEEQRADQPSRISRLLPVLRVAAAVVLVLGVGGLGIRLVQRAGGGDSPSSADSGATSAASAPVLSPVLSTGTNYTKGDLSSQVRTLVGRTQAQTGKGATARAAQPQAESSTESFAAAGASDASGDLLQSSAALRSCLTGIGEPDAQPVAVDLARYDNRDAAIIVIPADDGSYSVWVVARNCTAQDQGALAVVDNVKP